MKVSELIETLQRLKEKHGDLPVIAAACGKYEPVRRAGPVRRDGWSWGRAAEPYYIKLQS